MIAVAKAMRVIAPFDSAQGAMTLIALTALAVAILSQSSTQKPGFFTEILRLTL